MKRKDKCVGKVAYSQKSQCIYRILKFYETKKVKLRYYECPTCLDFHLSSKNIGEQFNEIMEKKKKGATLVNVQNGERNIIQKQTTQIAHSKIIIQRQWSHFMILLNTYEKNIRRAKHNEKYVEKGTTMRLCGLFSQIDYNSKLLITIIK